ncbi:sugar phosphate nucleotidyltransferase [Maricaulis sp. CAU 1757]
MQPDPDSKLPVVILAGGRGTRLGFASAGGPKALVTAGGKALIDHVMEPYRNAGFDRFIVATGYRADQIEAHFRSANDPGVSCVFTGEETNTGGRIKRLSALLSPGTFMLTYTDGIADIDIKNLLSFHRAHGRLATVTAVRPPPRFGHLSLSGAKVEAFEEKPSAREGWINGAYFVLEPEVIDYIDGDDVAFEGAPLKRLAAEGQLMAYRHDGFWRCVDTPADVEYINSLEFVRDSARCEASL